MLDDVDVETNQHIFTSTHQQIKFLLYLKNAVTDKVSDICKSLISAKLFLKVEKKVKVLLVGAAFSADLHMDGYARCTDIAEIVAICDKDLSRIDSLAARYGLKGFKSYDNYEKAIDEVDCDLVDICMPNFLHHDVALTAFKKGRHVISEKPLATTVEDAVEMVEAAEKAGKKLYYAEDWLFAPALGKAIAIVEEGGIGKPMYIRARESHGGSHSPFAQTIKYCGGGCMVHLGNSSCRIYAFAEKQQMD